MTTLPRAAKFLESALLFTFIMHGLAMVTMVLFLLPGLPGGSSVTADRRIFYVADHPWLWRAGWLGWQLTAVSDLLLAIALVSTAWISKPIASGVLAITILALIPDQVGQALWISKGTQLAHTAMVGGDYRAYLAFEARTFRWIAGYGTVGYLTAAFGWTWCFAAAGTWSHRLTVLSVATWGLFTAAAVVIFLPASLGASAALQKAVSTANAVAFVLLMIWLGEVTDRVLRRARPVTTHGSCAPWRHPGPGIVGLLYGMLANGRFFRALGERCPVMAMASDITDVIYINYLVPAERLRAMVPPMLELQRLGPNQSFALFSILIYRHGHFGPACFGPLRRWWPSPIQSNWRIYVVDPKTKMQGVHFVTTAITSTPHALATRLLSEGVPMHVPVNAEIWIDKDNAMHAQLDPGTGSAPDLQGEFRPVPAFQLSEPWQSCFTSSNQMLDYCVPQDRALAPQPWYSRIIRQEISLGIPISACKPLSSSVKSRTAESIVGNARPVCFKVDQVAFRFFGEESDTQVD